MVIRYTSDYPNQAGVVVNDADAGRGRDLARNRLFCQITVVQAMRRTWKFSTFWRDCVVRRPK